MINLELLVVNFIHKLKKRIIRMHKYNNTVMCLTYAGSSIQLIIIIIIIIIIMMIMIIVIIIFISRG